MISVFNNTDPSFNFTGDVSNTAGAAKPEALLAAFGPNYLGCYSDAGARTLTGKNTQYNNMSSEVCQEFCSQGAGYQYYGMEFGWQCKAGMICIPSTVSLTIEQAGAATA